MAAVRISVFGRLSVIDLATGRSIEITREAQRRVLAILAASQHVDRETFIERMWRGDPPPSARGALQTHVSALRRALPPGVIVTDGNGYRLDREQAEVDAELLAGWVAEASALRRAQAWTEVLAVTEQGSALGSGTPFDVLVDDAVASLVRAAADEHRTRLTEMHIEAMLEVGRADEAIPLATTATIEHPLRELGWELLVRAGAATGRRAEALRAVQDARSALAEAGLVPGPGLGEAERVALAVTASDGALRDNLPAPISSFVGRRHDRSALRTAISSERLVTLVGPGGVGKTRLAIETARELVRDQALDEAWLVELAAERDETQVLPRILAAIGIAGEVGPDTRSTTAALASRFRDRRALVVLDNCEHVIDGAASACRSVLEAAPSARIVATSRAALCVAGEWTHAVEPLSVPTDDDEPASTEAVELFLQRTRSYDAYTADDLALVGHVCRRLDGLPLAIELAAFHVRTLGLATLADRLETSMLTLDAAGSSVVDRHRTLDAAIAWSVDQLGDAERTLLERLSVFRGTADVATIEAVCGESEVTIPLDRLAARSLVAVVHLPGRTGYRLLEPVRMFAAQRCHDREALALAHLRYFSNRADELRLFWMQPPERRIQPTSVRWWDEIALSLDDVRAALETAGSVGAHLSVVNLAGLLAHVAAADGRHSEAVRLLDVALGEQPPDELEALLRSLLSSELASIDQVERASEEIDRAAALAMTLADGFEKMAVLSRAALNSLILPDRSSVSSVPLAEACMATATSVGIDRVTARVRALLATSYARANDGARAAAVLQQLEVDAARFSDDPAIAVLAATTALNVVYVGGVDRRHGAERWIGRAIDLLREHPHAVSADLGTWTIFALSQQGRYDEAEAILDGFRAREGYELIGALTIRARLRWLQDRLDEAADLARASFTVGSDRHWLPNLCATAAEVGAQLGDLAGVRAAVARLDEDLPRNSWLPMRLSTLRPLVQAEVDAALSADQHRRAAHVEAAQAAFDRMQHILAATPPESHATTQPETAATLVALAEAELTRLDPDPDIAQAAFAAIAELPDYVWYRDYCRRRAV